MDKKLVGSLLRIFRKERKKTLKDVAQTVDASSSYISQIEKGIRQPSDKTLMNILTKAFEMGEKEADILIREWRINTYGGNVFSGTLSLKARDAQHPEILPQGAFWFDELPLLPVYKSVSEDFDTHEPDTYWPFPVEDPKDLSNLFIYEMTDDSMEPKIPHRAHLVLDKDINDLPFGTIVLAIADGVTMIRQYEKREDKIKLFPANSAYPVYFGNNVKVLGRVVQMLVNI
jgi:SOS-response transcriptional repressor LexA